MSENAKKKIKKKETAKKEIAKKETVKKEKVKKDGEKKKISSKKLAIIITSGIIALILIALAIVLTVRAIKRDSGFNYLTSDLSKYIEFTEDYKDFEVSVDIAKPHDIDVDVTILNLIAADKSEKPLYGGNYVTSPITITPGDELLIWYRGYLVDDDGEEIAVDGMCNFTDSSAAELEIGSNDFIPGFELNLVGVNTGDYNKFSKITDGKVKDGQVAYVSYTRTELAETSKKTTGTNVRIDLSEDVDAEYGEGFKAKLIGLSIGEKAQINAKTETKTYSYTDLTVNFVTECEGNPIKVECYFPYDYSKEDLRNETAIFEVYVDKAIEYDAPEFNDEYLEKKIEDGDISITMETLNGYEGDSLVEKYRAYANETMEKIYQAEYDSLVEDAVWEHYNQIAKVKKYPYAKLEEVYNSYVSELNDYFIQNEGQVYSDYTGQYVTYDNLDDYATAYLGLGSSISWTDYIYLLSQNYIKEKFVLYYIVRTEGLILSEEMLNSEVEEIRQEYIDEYVSQYLEYEGKMKEDYSDEEYNELVEERKKEIFSYYDNDHFVERAYYSIAGRTLITWPKVSTLDDRRAYPVDQ